MVTLIESGGLPGRCPFCVCFTRFTTGQHGRKGKVWGSRLGAPGVGGGETRMGHSCFVCIYIYTFCFFLPSPLPGVGHPFSCEKGCCAGRGWQPDTRRRIEDIFWCGKRPKTKTINDGLNSILPSLYPHACACPLAAAPLGPDGWSVWSLVVSAWG